MKFKGINPQKGVFTLPRLAHEKAIKNRSKRGRKKRSKNDNIRNYVIKHLKLG